MNDKKLNIRNPKDAIKSGIVCVHQRPLLAPSISIRDNLRIGISHKMTKLIPELTKKWPKSLMAAKGKSVLFRAPTSGPRTVAGAQ